jgi:tricorn protease-like protein
MNLTWIKLTNGNWCPFRTVNLSSVVTKGVYMIWYSGNPSRVVRVGKGDIAARIAAHRNDPQITVYTDLFVTWAAVPTAQMDGVERYLADMWSPLVGDAFPDAVPLAVNSPWG